MLAVAALSPALPALAQEEVVPLEPPSPVRVPAPVQPARAVPPLDPRSHELLDHDCRSEVGRRRVTLFANGTVRVWDGLLGNQRMMLGELVREEVAGYLDRLHAIDLAEVPLAREGPAADGGGVAARVRAIAAAGGEGERSAAGGDWVEECMVTLDLEPTVAPRRYRFSRYDSLPLGLMAVVRIAEELSARALPDSELPLGYVAQRGDVLRRTDGSLFEVVRPTDDGQGLELRGLEQPLTLYVARADLRALFVALVSRQTGRR
jgi:hypothetical protein